MNYSPSLPRLSPYLNIQTNERGWHLKCIKTANVCPFPQSKQWNVSQPNGQIPFVGPWKEHCTGLSSFNMTARNNFRGVLLYRLCQNSKPVLGTTGKIGFRHFKFTILKLFRLQYVVGKMNIFEKFIFISLPGLWLISRNVPLNGRYSKFISKFETQWIQVEWRRLII